MISRTFRQCLLLFLLCPGFADASSATWDFSQAAIAARSSGFHSLSVSSKIFFISVSHSGIQPVLDCFQNNFVPNDSSRSELGNGCTYIAWTAFWVLFAVALAMLTIFGSICFCFARCCCSCCCRPCSAPACGGKAPTVIYSVMWASSHSVLYMSTLGLLLALTILGCICSMDANIAVTSTGKELLGAAEYISLRLEEVGPNVLQLSRSAQGIASEVNHRLDGIAAVNLTSKAFFQSIVSADLSVQDLQFYVEGCKSSISTCNLQQNPFGWNKCENGFHSKGKGTVMSSGNTNPACKDSNGNTKNCPCCINCSMTRGFLAEAQLRIPSEWGELDKKISVTEVDRYLQDASQSAENLINPFQNFVQGSKETIDRLVADVESKKETREGVIFAIWAPCWVIITFAILGAILSSYSEPWFESTSPLMHPGDIGCCFHWTAFSLAVLWVSLVVLPAFSVLSIVGLPLADLCRLAPQSGDDPSIFLQIFSKGSATSNSSYLSDIFRNCILLSNGSLVDSSLKERVDKAFDPLRVAKNRIPNRTVLDYLSAQSHSEPFDKANGVEFNCC
jgi:hypothetical protein